MTRRRNQNARRRRKPVCLTCDQPAARDRLYCATCQRQRDAGRPRDEDCRSRAAVTDGVVVNKYAGAQHADYSP